MKEVWAVSDLHGNYFLWRKVITSLGKDDTLFVLGDCADRGEAGWRIIKEALADERVVYIRGNHDQFILDCWKDDWFDTDLWFYNSGRQTYTAIMNDPDAEEYLQKLDKTPFHLEYYHKNRIIYLSHAGFTPSKVFPSETAILWDRKHIGDEVQLQKKVYIVHGHTPVRHLYSLKAYDVQLNPSCTVGRYCDGHKICIDGGTAFSHQCAILNLNTFEERVFTDEI